MLEDKLDMHLRDLITQWNIAEQRIKKAEQVRANEVVASAIFELRYAGRKLIDSLDLALSEPSKLSPGNEEYDKIHAFLADATEDCVKAKHDAIDAVMSFVTTWFHRVERKISLSKLQGFFPDYLESTGKIHDVQERIAASRQDRTRLRDEIYNDIDKDDYDQILGLFDRMRRSADRVEGEVRWDRLKGFAMWVITILGLAVGLVGLIATLKHW